MKYISFKINWVTDNEKKPPQEVIDNVSSKVRLWLHEEKGLEGELQNFEEEGRAVAKIRIMKPEEWLFEDVQAFCIEVTDYIKSFLDEPEN